MLIKITVHEVLQLPAERIHLHSVVPIRRPRARSAVDTWYPWFHGVPQSYHMGREVALVEYLADCRVVRMVDRFGSIVSV